MNTVTIIPDKQQIIIRFGYDPDLVAKVKTLIGRRWNAEAKHWTAPATPTSIVELNQWGFELSPGVRQWLKEQEPKPVSEIKATHFSRLFPYQQEGVQFIESRRGRALLAHEMGLGKTAMSLVWMDAHPELRPAIIICPASLKLNWEREIRMWMGTNPKVSVLTDRMGNKQISLMANIYIVNYDILADISIRHKDGSIKIHKGWVDSLKELNPQMVICDESHFCKSSKTSRTKAVKSLCKDVPHVLMLSGTPIVNRPAEMFNALNILSPATFPSFTKYAFRYCGARHNGFGWDFSGTSHTEELHKLLVETCLPYESIVYLDSGPMPIGEVVEKKIKANILCRDNVFGEIQWRPINAYSARPAPNRMLRILHESGELHCTPDHLVWTEERGYIRAEALEPNLSLLVVQKDKARNFIKSEDERQILFCSLCGAASNLIGNSLSENGVSEMGESPTTSDSEDLLDVPAGVLSSQERYLSAMAAQEKVLLCQVRCKMESITPNPINIAGANPSGKIQKRTKTSLNCKPVDRKIKTSRGHSRAFSIFANQTESIYCTKESLGKNRSRGSEAKVESKENFSASQKASLNSGMAQGASRISNPNQSYNRTISERYQVCFLCGSCRSLDQAGNRSRWSESQRSFPKIKGQRTREMASISRVVCVEDYQSRNQSECIGGRKSNFVYDLQVESNHNFFADECLVHNCMLRRLKADVLKDLPDKLRSVIPMEIDNRKEYDYASNDLVAWLKEQGDKAKAEAATRAEALVRIEALKQLAAKGKLAQALEWVEDFLEQGQKLVVFATHKLVVKALMEQFKDHAVQVDGLVSGEDRQRAVDRFQTEDAVRLFVGNVKAAGIGLTLTAASNAAFLELDWSTGMHLQAEDRCHRIGQKSAVNIWYLIAQGTIEETILHLLMSKEKTLNAVLDGKVDIDSENVFESLLRELRTN